MCAIRHKQATIRPFLVIVAVVALAFVGSPDRAHDFGGGSGPGPPPPGDGCPDCCGGGGGGGGCASGGPNCGNAGDPVNLWDGSERHSSTDLTLQSYIPMRFTRIYDSRVDYDSPMGYGWSHSFDFRVFRYPDGSVMLRRTCGGRRLFVPMSGGFISPAGEYRNMLEEDGDGTLTLIESAGTAYAFDLRGRLESITDVHGNMLELQYDPGGRLPLMGASRFSPNPTTLGVVSLDYRLTTVRERDALGTLTGREFNLVYDAGTGRISSVSDFTGRTWTYSHDPIGNLTGVAGPEAIALTYAYNDPNDSHNLTSVDEGLDAFTLEYDTADRVMRQTRSTGTVWDMTYDVPGLQTTVVQTVKDGVGAVLSTGTWVYEFNSIGNPTRTTDPMGHEFTYGRDGEGNTTVREIREFVPGTGLVLIKTTTMSYDAAGNVMSEVHRQESTGEEVTKLYTYDGNLVATERVSSSLDPATVHGFDRVYAHNAGGFPTVVLEDKRIVADGATPTPTFYTLTLTHNPFGQRTQILFPNGDTEVAGYTNGYLTGNDGEVLTRDLRGNLLTRTDRGSHLWTYTYDDLDRLATATDPTLAQSIFTWNGHFLDQTEHGKTATEAGGIQIFTRNGVGQVTQIQRQTIAGPVATFTSVLDSEGRVIELTDGASRTSFQTFDILGRQTSRTDGAGGVTSYEYDAMGRLTKVTDGEGRETLYTNWVIDEQAVIPLTVTDGLSKTYTASLDATGLLNTLTDPLNRTLTEFHDAAGQLTGFETPSGAATTRTYGGRRFAETKLDPLGGTTTYTYNGRGQLSGIDYPGADALTMTLNADDLRERAVDLDSDVSYAYDGAHRMTQETNNLTTRSVTYSFDGRGRRTGLTTSDGLTVVYGYNDLDHVVSITRNGTPEITYTRDNSGKITQATYGSGMTVDYVWDGAGRLESQETRDASSTLLNRVVYTRDLSGLITVKHETVRRPNATTSELYFHSTYDLAKRLTREETRAADDVTIISARDFTYDDVGNRQTMTVDGGPTTTYVYGLDYELLSETTGGSSITYTYDANGNLATETFGASTVTYSYDAENRLIGVNSPTDTVSYVLSWDGRRLAKTANGSTTHFVYDGMNLVAEYPDASPTIGYLPGLELDEWILRAESGQKRYYAQLQDLRSVMQVTDSAGGVVQSHVYEAFGETLEEAGSSPSVFRFAGRRRDAESGNMYFRERLYSPRTGRFLSLDPFRPDVSRSVRIGEPQRFAVMDDGVQDSPLFDTRRDVGVNGMDVVGYQYVGNNPVNATDPTGEAILWNPVSASGTSVCLGSACSASFCFASGCWGSGCAISLCAASACLFSNCLWSSVCLVSGCHGSECLGSLCKKSACFITLCWDSNCGDSSGCSKSGCAESGGCKPSCKPPGCT